MAIKAVLTGDIVNSTKLGAAAEKKLVKTLQQLLADYQFEFYRGDSFQVYLKEANKALQTALLCRSAAISITQGEQTIASDVRISIGIGQVNTRVLSLGSAK